MNYDYSQSIIDQVQAEWDLKEEIQESKDEEYLSKYDAIATTEDNQLFEIIIGFPWFNQPILIFFKEFHRVTIMDFNTLQVELCASTSCAPSAKRCILQTLDFAIDTLYGGILKELAADIKAA